jgi:cytochrome oxidase Cu insertion factor (SCO1/SenC/PrrC family)
MTAFRVLPAIRGALILGSIAALALLAARVNGSGLQSFDGSVAFHHVEGIELIDDTSKPIVIGRSMHGTVVVLGYTRCTDECPLTLARVAAAISGVPQEERPKAFFVTVDPRHDDPPTLRRYLNRWGHSITGVTGERAALGRFYIALGSADPGSSYRDHDTRIFLLNSDGDVERELSPGASPQEIKRSLTL